MRNRARRAQPNYVCEHGGGNKGRLRPPVKLPSAGGRDPRGISVARAGDRDAGLRLQEENVGLPLSSMLWVKVPPELPPLDAVLAHMDFRSSAAQRPGMEIYFTGANMGESQKNIPI